MTQPKHRREKDSPTTSHMTKKCPECYTYLTLDAVKCHACGKRVGPIDKLGFAGKLVNLRSYLVAIVFALVLVAVFWLGFFTE
jgi:hypothetical protein